MSLHLIVIIAISIMYLLKIWRNRSKPLTGFEFYWQLTGALALIALAWLGGGEGRIEYKILLTVLGVVGLAQCILVLMNRKRAAVIK